MTSFGGWTIDIAVIKGMAIVQIIIGLAIP